MVGRIEEASKGTSRARAALLLLANASANETASTFRARRIFVARMKVNKDTNPSIVTYTGSARASTDPTGYSFQSRVYAVSGAGVMMLSSRVVSAISLEGD